ncbi:YbjN domain-containing protein [Marinactinospora thermotolerans]|uniref:Putative sensory transduction regulator n=1 Tax=Marinactinospora thermotolerans DSM 45154 TaxID=1122192 RepID=A0A1T4MZI7_9ACTN|nr:YbjN domain-containing protein [Marinactinospora thermotolerans]SJZ72311.1 Putative sensory transduction regulator [Marinactinospora thermotolerans DSM 45154]
MPSQEQSQAIEAIRTALREAGLEFERPDPDAFVVTLPGERKLKTLVWLGVGEHSLLVKTFFCRRPDENEAEFYRWLMRKNSDMYGVAFAADEVGDVYITGRLPLGGVTPREVDRLLGCVLTYSDDNFNPALERGFASAIRKEWEWRTRRGENPRNLRAFRHLLGEPVSERTGDQTPALE